MPDSDVPGCRLRGWAAPTYPSPGNQTTKYVHCGCHTAAVRPTKQPPNLFTHHTIPPPSTPTAHQRCRAARTARASLSTCMRDQAVSIATELSSRWTDPWRRLSWSSRWPSQPQPRRPKIRPPHQDSRASRQKRSRSLLQPVTCFAAAAASLCVCVFLSQSILC
ncbi:hypothetical protein BRADI_2g41237v3 [Brachypodium distachyon]|uniref:Uncharacterized protein n=1 Tax=Brachypodium distachyon TaxID=15368 RepID=A0A2K2DD55_BRADI|nr:hypothetical protein BRADI_2g41237v3 [Brachypodium distachyon]